MSGTPYIGSKISLVSKAKIRYEGYLYTIDQNESTVTLAKVKSLGTENRCPNDPVPAREEIFEYIVFRGHDIEDLHVSEGPKKPEPKQQMSDPAIAHSGPIQQTQNFSQSNQYPNFSPFGGGMSNMYPQPYSNRPAEPMMNRQTPPTLPRTPTPEPVKPSNDRSQNQARSRTDSNRSNERKISYDKPRNNERNDNQNRYNNRRDNKEDTRNYRDNRDVEKKERNDNRDRRDNRYNSRDNQRNRDEHRNERSDKGDVNASMERRRGAGGRGRGNRGGNRNSNRGTREKFTEDFNFEESNAKFNKEEIEKELLKVLNKVKITDEEEEEKFEEKEKNDNAPLPSPDKFYDRSKSFFDNISCEAMGPKPAPVQPKPEETGGPNISRRQERALNIETFGSNAGYYRRGGYRGRGGSRGRGRGRGRGGAGGGISSNRGRGSYSRGNSSSRSWVDYDFDYEAAGIKSRNPPKTSS